MATIKKRNSTFFITVSLGYNDEGKQVRKTTTFTPPENVTDKKAERLAKEFAFEFEKRCKGKLNLNENMKFSELVEEYFRTYAENELKPCTKYNYEVNVRKRINPAFGSVKLKHINAVMITNFLMNLDVKPTTAKKIYVIMQSIFTFAVKYGLIKESPCEGVILPKKKYDAEEKKPCLDIKQTKQLIRMLDDAGYSEFTTIIKVLLYTGMRAGECLALQWEDIDFDNQLIHIKHNLADVAGKHWLDTPKTKGSVRTVAMGNILCDILLKHRHEYLKKKLALGIAFKRPNMVFTSETGDFKDRSRLNLQFKRFIKDTDFADISLHKLRHANATLLLYQGVDLKLVSEHLGHSNITVTADIYADVLQDSKKTMANLVEFNLEEKAL